LNWFCLERQGHGIEFNLALIVMSAGMVISGGGEASVYKW